MKKSGLLMLVAMVFLITTSISADRLDLSDPMLFEQLFTMGSVEIKTNVQEEVADITFVSEINAVLSVGPITAESVSKYMSTAPSVIAGSHKVSGSHFGGIADRLKYPITA